MDWFKEGDRVSWLAGKGAARAVRVGVIVDIVRRKDKKVFARVECQRRAGVEEILAVPVYELMRVR